MAEIVKADNLWFSYPGVDPVLKGVSLSIQEGEFWGLIGTNGSGKTTLVKLLVGQLSPQKGTLQVFGKMPQDASEFIGYVPQTQNFDRTFPIAVEDVVLTGLVGSKTLFGGFRKSEREKAQQVLEQLKLSHLAQNTIGELSGGELQRVLVARALIKNPKLLVLDEAFSQADPLVEEKLYSLIKGWNENISILMVSHDVGLITHHVSKVACLKDTLVVHETEALDSQVLQDTYGENIRIIKHSHTHEGGERE